MTRTSIPSLFADVPAAAPRRGRPWLWTLLSLALLAGDAGAQTATVPAQYTGWFHVVHGDGFGGPSTAITRYVLIDDRGRWHHLSVDQALLDRPGGARAWSRHRVRITGRSVARRTVPGLAGTPSILEVQAIQRDPGAAAESQAALTGAQPWVTILCRFADSPSVTPRPTSYFQGLIGSAAPGLDHYWSEVSDGAITLSGSVVAGWYDLPHPRGYYVYPTGSDAVEHLDFDRSASDCTAAAGADVFLPDFAGINLMFNDTLDCCSWGGGATLTRDGQTRPYGVTWLPPWAYAHQYVVAHEMGHGFGLPHSSGPYASTYDSDWDVMSGGGTCAAVDPTYGCVAVHTISYHKDLLGWIQPERAFTPAPARAETIALDRLALPGTATGYLMARIPIAGSATEFYTVEARRRAGYDSQIPGEALVIHRVDTTRSDREARVVDPDGNGNPNDAGAMWVTGETFTDPEHQISVVVGPATATTLQATILAGGFRLSVETAGAGSGTVSAVPGPIDCGATCAAVYSGGAVVTLTATPEAGSALAGWSGCDAVAESRCTVTMSANRAVAATFARPVRLSVTVSGSGGVSSVPAGIDCGATCAATFAGGTAVTLVATPDPGNVFAGWSGSAGCADALVLVADTACAAAFRPAPDLLVTRVANPPTAARPGSRLTATDTVLNRGLAAAPATRVRYYLSLDTVPGGDKLLLGARAVGALAPGAASTGAATVWIPWSTTVGRYYLIACADDVHAVKESDETGNCLASAQPVELSWRP